MESPQFEDVVYSTEDAITTIRINRPERYNAVRGKTVDELIASFRMAWADPSTRAIILTGTGDRAFCTGGDVKQRIESGDYGPTASGMFEIDYLHRLIRDVPKPVIAAVNGYAIGGGNVLQVLCDLTIAADNARFGQVGPKVGSFDGGFGTTYLARVIGEKRAREMWFLCREFDADKAERIGLVNAVVPQAELMDEARRWATEIAQLSPTALRFLKTSFNADTEHQAGLAGFSAVALNQFVVSDEGREGAIAFGEKRAPDFSAYS